MRVITAKRIWEVRLIAVVRYRVQRLHIRHVLDHRDYDKGKWKE